jgi:hypothetical protein
MKVGDLVLRKFELSDSTSGTVPGLVIRCRTGANAGIDKSVVEVMWSSLNKSSWHAGCVLEIVS